MTTYNLPGMPNQTFDIQIDNVVLHFGLRLFRGSMFMDIDHEDEHILSGARVVRGVPLLPREWSDRVGGNFEFSVLGSDYPTYEMLGKGTAYIVFKETGEE